MIDRPTLSDEDLVTVAAVIVAVVMFLALVALGCYAIAAS